MGAAAPKPKNFRALANAWHEPIAFARELSAYYAQLRESGHWQNTPDRTESHREEMT